MGQIALFFAILCGALLCAETQFNIGRKIQFRKLALCPGYKNFTILYDQVQFKRDEKGNTIAMGFRMIVKKEVKKLAIVVTFKKCDDYGTPDSCEYFLKDYNASNICEIMGQKGQIWTTFMDSFTLPKECPIKEGTYYLKDGPLSGYLLSFLPIPNAYWKVNFKGYDEEGLHVSCVDVEFAIYTGRNKLS